MVLQQLEILLLCGIKNICHNLPSIIFQSLQDYKIPYLQTLNNYYCHGGTNGSESL